MSPTPGDRALRSGLRRMMLLSALLYLGLTLLVAAGFVIYVRNEHRDTQRQTDATARLVEQNRRTIRALQAEIAERRKLGRETLLDICRRTNVGFEKFAEPLIATLKQAIRDTERINKPGGIQLPTFTEADKRRAIANDLKLIAALKLHPLGNCLKLPTVAHTPPAKPTS